MYRIVEGRLMIRSSFLVAREHKTENAGFEVTSASAIERHLIGSM